MYVARIAEPETRGTSPLHILQHAMWEFNVEVRKLCHRSNFVLTMRHRNYFYNLKALFSLTTDQYQNIIL